MTRRFADDDAAAGPDDPDVAPRARDSQLHGQSSSDTVSSSQDGRQATIDEWAAPATSGRGDPPAPERECPCDSDADLRLDPDLAARVESNAADIETLSRTLATVADAIRERTTIGECDDWTPNRGFQ